MMQKVVQGLANISGYPETNKEKASFSCDHVLLITSHSLLSTEEIIKSSSSEQPWRTYKLHFMRI